MDPVHGAWRPKCVLRNYCLHGIQMKRSKGGKQRQSDGESKGQKARNQGTEMEVGQQDLESLGRETEMEKERNGVENQRDR